MAIGTDEEIFKDKAKPKRGEQSVGRPKVDRSLALRLFQAKYDNKTVAGYLKIQPRTAAKIRRELTAEGLLGKLKTERDLVEVEFDKECTRATGFSFKEWLHNKRKPEGANKVFSFCEKVWRLQWDRPSLFLAADRTNNSADKLAQNFLSEYKEDTARIRSRKKHLRQLFTFLGRSDINDRHLKMTASRDPRRVRQVPEIPMLGFPVDLDNALNEFESIHGFVAVTWLKLKICTGIRTGDKKEKRGLAGLSADTKTKSFVMFRGGTWRAQVFEKKGETWPITWLPADVLADLRKLYDAAQKRPDKMIFTYSKHERTQLLKSWRAISKKHTGAELTFHDLRKVSITWLYAMNIPLEIATTLNVGWRDLSTARDHYLDLRSFLKKSARVAYAANIPEWYKDGLEEYSREE